MDYQPLSIRQILDQISSGQIRIPAFQREFVWEMDLVAFLMDSIYKGFPFGSLLFWRTKAKLVHERTLGPFKLPDPKADYPIDYVLDGQQRITSIFTVFQSDLKMEPNSKWVDIYFDLSVGDDAQETQFYALKPDQVDETRHFPLKTLFSSVEYRKATAARTDPTIIQKIDNLQERFKEATIPVQVLRTEDRTQVAIVFERVNRLGVKLDTLQLLAAWTWNEDFDLLNRFKELRDELEEFGFEGIGEDTNLMLRCSAAVLTGNPTPESLITLSGQTVRQEFEKVENGIRGAIDFLRKQVAVQYLKNLPFPAMLAPLSVFFAEPDGKSVSYSNATLNRIKRWFWKSCFSGRYTSQTKRTIQADIEEIKKLKEGKANTLGDFNFTLASDFFTSNQFRLASSATQTFILLLAQKGPKSLLSGAEVDLEKVLQKYNRSEFHHLFPKAYLKENGVAEDEINSLVNFCFINSIENKQIGKKKPSVYKTKMPTGDDLAQVLSGAFCDICLFDDDFAAFKEKRSEALTAEASRLMA